MPDVSGFELTSREEHLSLRAGAKFPLRDASPDSGRRGRPIRSGREPAAFASARHVSNRRRLGSRLHPYPDATTPAPLPEPVR